MALNAFDEDDRPLRAACLSLQLAFFLVALVLLAATWWRAVYWYPQLPERFPTHFDFQGNANGWSQKSPAAWFMLPGIGVFIMVLLSGIAASLTWLAAHAPGLINIPHQKLFIALPARARLSVLAPTRTYLAWVMLAVCGLFLWIVEGTGRVATGAATVLPAWPPLVLVGLILAGLVPYWRATRRALEGAAQAISLIPPG